MFKKIALAVGSFALPVVSALAEGETGGTGGVTSGGSTISDWVNTVQTETTSWASDLAPLFGVGITILLLVVAWKLFKRVTKSAT